MMTMNTIVASNPNSRFEVKSITRSEFQKRFIAHMPTTVEVLGKTSSVYGSIPLPFDYNIDDEEKETRALRNNEFFKYLTGVAKRANLTKQIEVEEVDPSTKQKVTINKIVPLDCTLATDRQKLFNEVDFQFTITQPRGE